MNHLQKTLSIALLAFIVTSCDSGTITKETGTGIIGIDTDTILIPGTDSTTDTDTSTSTDTDVGDDADGDGYSVAEGDCDDSDPAVNPGAPNEDYFKNTGGKLHGDDKDNDCDGKVDETFCACGFLVEKNADGSMTRYAAPDGSTVDEENVETDEAEGTDVEVTSSSGTGSGSGSHRRSRAQHELSQMLKKWRTKTCSHKIEEIKASPNFDCEVDESAPRSGSGSGSGSHRGSGSGSPRFPGLGSGIRPGLGSGVIIGHGSGSGGHGHHGSGGHCSDGHCSGTSSSTDAGTDEATDESTDEATDESTSEATDESTDEATDEGTSSGTATATAVSVNINGYYVAWRGMTLNPENIGRYGDAKAYLNTTNGDMTGTSKSVSVSSTFKVDLLNTADNSGGNESETDADKYDATIRYTLLGYDNSAMKVLTNRSAHFKYTNNTADNTSETIAGDAIYVPETFSWSEDPVVEDETPRYEYYVAIRGHSIDCTQTVDGQDAESFAISAYIHNGFQVNTYESDDDGNDHLVGKDNKLYPRIVIKFTQPNNKVNDCTVYVHYDVIGIDNTRIGAKWFGTSDATGSGSDSDPYVDTVTIGSGVSTKNAFVVTGSMGFDGGDTDNSTDHYTWMDMWYSSYIDSISGGDAKVHMKGYYHTIRDGAGSSTSGERHIYPGGSYGYLIYAKDGKSIQGATQDYKSDSNADGSEGITGTTTLTIDDI